MPHVFDDAYPSDSEEEDATLEPAVQGPKLKRQRKRGPGNQHRAFTCSTAIQCDMFDAESADRISVQARTEMLEEHLRTRLNHNRPDAVKAFAVVVDSSHYSGPPATYSVPITVYIQTKNTTSIPLDAWLGCVCKHVPGGLCGNHAFDTDMEKPAPWVILPLFNTLKLNNAGKAAKKVIARQFHRVNFNF
jgi:hypothetical protein